MTTQRPIGNAEGAASAEIGDAGATQAKRPERSVVPDGERIVVRPVRPEDRDAYAHFILCMDERDLRQRFAWPSGVPAAEDRLARDDAVTFVAVRPSGATEEIVGEIRGYRYPDASAMELAIMVRSDMKRRGIARLLMAELIGYCAEQGFDLIAQTRPDNGAMIGLAIDSGMEVEHVPGSDLVVAYLPARAASAKARAASTIAT